MISPGIICLTKSLFDGCLKVYKLHVNYLRLIGLVFIVSFAVR